MESTSKAISKEENVSISKNVPQLMPEHKRNSMLTVLFSKMNVLY